MPLFSSFPILVFESWVIVENKRTKEKIKCRSKKIIIQYQVFIRGVQGINLLFQNIHKLCYWKEERKKEQKKDRKTRPSYLLFTVSPGTGTVDGRLRLYDSGAINVVVQSWPSVGGSGQEQPQLSPSNEGQVHDVINRPFYMGKNLLQISVRGQT